MIALASLSLLIWLVLIFGRGRFWLMRERDSRIEAPPPHSWPSVTAIVPARDEADVIAYSVGSLLAQDYPGSFHIILVDDQSSDGTSDIIRKLPMQHRLTILQGSTPPEGWTGKLWAVKQGITQAHDTDFVWLTDADIEHSANNLRHLVMHAERDQHVLVSLMAKLHCRTFAEKLMIPAFVYFFDMLFPFPLVNRPDHPLAAAAGGCMLIRRVALEKAGNIDAICNEIIDDCAMGRLMKKQGSIWLGFTRRAMSIRPYTTLREIRHMIARSAFAQLDYSVLYLLGTVLGMVTLFVLPPVLAILAEGWVQYVSVATWLAMTISIQPMLRFYKLSPYWGAVLPLIALLYTAYTVDSAIQFWRGKGGMWKGRAQAIRI